MEGHLAGAAGRARCRSRRITNGVHTQSWLSPGDRRSSTTATSASSGRSGRPTSRIWKRVEHIPDAELWRTHERGRERLVAFARQPAARRSSSAAGRRRPRSPRAEEVLDPEALTIGFARRFATYKRGDLIFRDLERLAAIVNDKDRPVQFIFAGKAHPQDHGGKELIAESRAACRRRPEFRRRVVFLEDYDMNVARYLVQGVDVWLNNPRRPLEASGTSGMKVCRQRRAQPVDPRRLVGARATTATTAGRSAPARSTPTSTYQDEVESRALYDLLEQEIVPLFYTPRRRTACRAAGSGG